MKGHRSRPAARERYAEEVHAAEVSSFSEARSEPEPSRGDVAGEHLVQARLVKPRFARVQQGRLAFVDVHAEVPAPDH